MSYRKNVGGNWQICTLSLEEAKAIQDRLTNHALLKVKKIREIATENKIELGDSVLAVILDKVVPSYESLANDFIEDKIKKELENRAAAAN